MEELFILIVDDDHDVSGFIERRLKVEAPLFYIKTLDDARSCLEYLAANASKVDCILSDFQMPGMDGLELLKAIRETGDDTPFIFVTGQGNEEVARDAFKNGAYDYFTKDIGFAHFTRIVNSVKQAVRRRHAEMVRAESEKALLEERNKLQAIISSIGDGLSIQDTDYRIIYQNAFIEKMGGKHVGECCYSAYEEKDAVCEGCPLKKSFEDGGTHSAERCVVKFGRPLAVEITTSPIRDSSGKVVGGIELVRNITERKAREQELEELESRFRGLVEGSSIGAVIIQDGVFVYVNPRFAEMLGYTVEELMGREPQSVVHPDDSHIVNENIRRRMSGEIDTVRYTTRMLHKQGMVLHIEVHGSRSAYKGRPAIVGSALDITEQRHAQASLEHSLVLLDTISRAEYHIHSGERPKPLFEELLKRILDLTGSEIGFIGEVYQDRDGRPFLKTYSLIAPGCDMPGYDGHNKSNGEGREFSNLNALFGEVLSARTVVISNDPSTDPRGRGLPDGHVPLMSFMGVPFISACTGELVGMVGIGNRPGGYDEKLEILLKPFITTCANIIDVYRNEQKRKAAEEALAMSQERLLDAQRIAGLGHWDWDIAASRLYWSDEIYRIFDTSPGEFGDDYESFLGFVHPEDRDMVKESVGMALEERAPYNIDHRIILPDGRERVVTEIAEVVFDEEGRAVRMQGTVQDITERKASEWEIDRLSRQNRLILESAGEGIYGLDTDGRMTFINKAALDMTGWALEELEGRLQHDMIHHTRPDGTPYPVEQCRIYDAFKKGVVHRVSDEVFWRKNGTSFPVEYTSTPIIEDGIITGAVAVFKDITKRKKDEFELHERVLLAALGADVGSALTKGLTIEDMLQGCAEAMVRHLDAAFARIWVFEGNNMLVLRASAGIYTNTKGTRSRVRVGEAGFKIGMIAETLKPHLTNDIRHDPGIIDKDWAEREGLVAFAGHPLVVEGRLVGVMAMFAKKPLSSATIDALASVADNIALGIERKRAGIALKESEEKFRSLVEESLVGAFILVDGRFAYINPRIAEMYGYSEDELLGAERAVDFIHPDDRENVIKEVNRRLDKEQRSTHYNCRIIKKDGDIVYIEALAWATNYRGRPAIIGTVLDVTGKLLAEKEREAVYHMMTHDIKGPLTVIQGYSDMLPDKLVGEDGREIAGAIAKATGKITAMIKDMLDFSRLESGKVSLAFVPVSLAELVSSVVKDNELATAEMGLSVVVDIEDDMPKVECDSMQLGRAVGNLVGNAVVYNKKGGRINIRGFAAGGAEGEAVLEVSDTGIGISEEDARHVFEKYYRSKGSGRKAGTGLGLAIVKAVVDAHGGSVELDSEVGKGSTFRVRIPLRH